MKTKPPLFALPKLGSWLGEAQSSDWARYGLTYAMIFCAFTTVGLAASKIMGPWEGADERRRQQQRPMRSLDLRSAWGSSGGADGAR